MNILAKLTSFVGGGLFKEIKDVVNERWPPDMSPQEKAEANLAIERVAMEKQMQADKILTEAGAQLDRRIAEQEGTAKDLLALPIIGRLMLFVRGIQRPVWGFATLYIDYRWFFDAAADFSEQQELALTVINLLVLGFLFGERAVKNLEPIIMKIFDRMTK